MSTADMAYLSRLVKIDTLLHTLDHRAKSLVVGGEGSHNWAEANDLARIEQNLNEALYIITNGEEGKLSE